MFESTWSPADAVVLGDCETFETVAKLAEVSTLQVIHLWFQQELSLTFLTLQDVVSCEQVPTTMGRTLCATPSLATPSNLLV